MKRSTTKAPQSSTGRNKGETNSAFVASVAQKVDHDCHTNHCKKGNCSLSLSGAPVQRLIVDLDCETLRIPANRKRCDYLFLGEEDSTAWVVPIELKGGGFKADEVVEQLQGGCHAACDWLPLESSFRFVPVLAYGKRVHRKNFRDLRRRNITLRGKKSKIETLHCGEKLKKKLS